jgi:hypothetical protein
MTFMAFDSILVGKKYFLMKLAATQLKHLKMLVIQTKLMDF